MAKHGRLIDADALEWHEQIEPLGDGKYEYVRVVYMDDIDDAPTIEPEQKKGVPRDAIKYILRKETVSTNPDDFAANEKFIQFMDDPEIASFGRWQLANGFNTALVAVKCELDKIPDAEPERKKGRWKEITEGDCSGYDPVLAGYDDPVVAYICSCCSDGYEKDVMGDTLWNFCPNCGADMGQTEDNYNYERAVEQLEHDTLYEPTFNPDDGSM